MPIKLNRVIKDLKVGLSTVVDFLHRKGYNIESNPNVKISDEQYNLLLKEFGNGITTKGYLPEKTNRPPETIKKESVHKQDEPEEIITKIPESKIPHFVTKGKIDLDALSPKKYAEDTQHLKSVEKDVPDKLDESNQDEPENDISVIESEKVELIIEPPVTEVENDDIEIEKVGNDDNFVPSDKDLYVEDDGNHEDDFEKEDSSYEKEEEDEEEDNTDNTDSADNDDYEEEEEPEDDNDQRFIEEGDDKEEIFRLHETKIKSNIKVTGKIDLSAINQATSPRRKTKEEKQKEREERHNKQMEERKNAQAATAAKPKEQHGSFSKPKEQQGGYTKPKEQSGYTKPKEQGGYTKSKDYGTQGKPKEFGGPGKLKERGAPGSSKDQSLSDDRANKKRKRIKKERVDVSNTPGTNVRRDDNRNKQPRVKRPVRVEVSEEDVQKQVKETLARLTTKNSKGKGAKYRREKRDLAASREKEIQEEEMRTSKVLQLTEFVTANDLASMMNVPVTQVISTCMSIGMMVSINQRLDAETINIVAEEFGFTTEYVSADVVEAIAEEEDREEDLVSRPPIITVMGHVDHGKTSLLDNIRKTNVIAGEAGGITQHIGAYNVKLPSGRRITFLDTPGHEAFTAMRARGAQVTDIAIIIVAADDNVMPQTVEAINHASAAVVPIVFAINKIDKPHANPEKIKEELAGMNYLVEDWGGKYQSQEISAKQGIGVPELLEKVLLEADMLNLKANPDKNAVGSIIESSLDKGRGYISTILVSNGTLRQGDVVLAGKHYGRIKAMFNERNQRIDEAGPSAPVLILGLDGAPQAGDAFNVLDTEQEAREIATRRQQLQRELGIRTQKRFGLEELGRRRALGDFHELNLIVKGDVDGSVEALSDSLIRLSTEEIQVNVIHKAVGQISESDISLAQTADAIIIGFQVRPSSAARRMADNEGVEIRLYSIIYNAINEVRDAMEGLLSPEIREDITSEVEVLQVFKITKVGTIAGCMVKEGKIKRTQKVRVIRDGIVVHSGELASLKRFKDEVKEVYTGQECGIHVSNYNDMQIGDIIESYDQTEIKKTL